MAIAQPIIEQVGFLLRDGQYAIRRAVDIQLTSDLPANTRIEPRRRAGTLGILERPAHISDEVQIDAADHDARVGRQLPNHGDLPLGNVPKGEYGQIEAARLNKTLVLHIKTDVGGHTLLPQVSNVARTTFRLLGNVANCPSHFLQE